MSLFSERRVLVIAPLLWRVVHLCQLMVTSGPVLSDECSHYGAVDDENVLETLGLLSSVKTLHPSLAEKHMQLGRKKNHLSYQRSRRLPPRKTTLFRTSCCVSYARTS